MTIAFSEIANYAKNVESILSSTNIFKRQEHQMTIAFSEIANYAKNVESILSSTKKTTLLIEQFRRDNETIATWFKDVISGYLAQRGWFVAGSLSARQYQALKDAIKKNNKAEIEDFMVQHVRSITKDTASAVYAKWPRRQAILADAFDAHSKKLYTLSVPVMLAQADGMAFDILGAYLFTGSKGKIGKKAKAMIEGKFKQRPLAKSFLGLLIEPSGLRLSTEKLNKPKAEGLSGSPLNRHAVLHGIDCDYPKECNSLRAIALINFLNWVHEITSEQNVP